MTCPRCNTAMTPDTVLVDGTGRVASCAMCAKVLCAAALLPWHQGDEQPFDLVLPAWPDGEKGAALQSLQESGDLVCVRLPDNSGYGIVLLGEADDIRR